MTDKTPMTELNQDAERAALAAFPEPYSPHTSVNMRADDCRKAFKMGFLDARRTPLTAGVTSVKDHEIRELVNTLRDIAVQYHATQQLRSRIQDVILPIFARAQQPVVADGAALELPPLPRKQEIARYDGPAIYGYSVSGYRDEQMQQYAREAIALYQRKQAKESALQEIIDIGQEIENSGRKQAGQGGATIKECLQVAAPTAGGDSIRKDAQFHLLLEAVCDASQELDQTTEGGEATFAAADKLARAQIALIAHIDTLLQCARSAGDAVPAGFKLVPVEPTMAMVAALAFKGDELMAIGHSLISKEVMDDYAAMLAAAPAPGNTEKPKR